MNDPTRPRSHARPRRASRSTMAHAGFAGTRTSPTIPTPPAPPSLTADDSIAVPVQSSGASSEPRQAVRLAPRPSPTLAIPEEAVTTASPSHTSQTPPPSRRSAEPSSPGNTPGSGEENGNAGTPYQPSFLRDHEEATARDATFTYLWKQVVTKKCGSTGAPPSLRCLAKSCYPSVLQAGSKRDLIFRLMLHMEERVAAGRDTWASAFNPHRTNFFNLPGNHVLRMMQAPSVERMKSFGLRARKNGQGTWGAASILTRPSLKGESAEPADDAPVDSTPGHPAPPSPPPLPAPVASAPVANAPTMNAQPATVASVGGAPVMTTPTRPTPPFSNSNPGFVRQMHFQTPPQNPSEIPAKRCCVMSEALRYRKSGDTAADGDDGHYDENDPRVAIARKKRRASTEFALTAGEEAIKEMAKSVSAFTARLSALAPGFNATASPGPEQRFKMIETLKNLVKMKLDIEQDPSQPDYMLEIVEKEIALTRRSLDE